jgi:hypothetical protein
MVGERERIADRVTSLRYFIGGGAFRLFPCYREALDRSMVLPPARRGLEDCEVAKRQ